MPVKPAKIHLLGLLALLGAAAATPSAAQTVAPTTASVQTEDDLVVTGRLPPASLQREIRRFVRGHARLSRIDQLVRWDDPICVRVMNLPAAYSAFIVNRIVAVARQAGAPTSDAPECAPNISIIFTTEAQAVLDQVRSNAPVLLGYHRIGERDALATMTRPIQAWYVTATGNDLQRAIDDPMYDPPAGVTGSRLTHGLRSEFVHILILVDANAVADAPIGPIADYLAMLSLTQLRDETWACGGLVTVMELFSGTCPNAPQALTTPDQAFLQGLYTMDDTRIGSLQRGHIANRMQRALDDAIADVGLSRSNPAANRQ